MAIPVDASWGETVRWIGPSREEMTGPETSEWVRPGDEGTFHDFDGVPGDPEVVVNFPRAGVMVCSVDDVELVR